MKNFSTLSFIEKQILKIKKNSSSFHNSEPIIINASSLIEVLKHLKTHHNMAVLTDIFGSDNLKDTEYKDVTSKRFNIHYLLLNIKINFRIFLQIQISENQEIDSASQLFQSACWFERELYDMYGIKIKDLTDHRRILTDYNFQGHPLRKDFPLSGKYEVAYSIAENKVIRRPTNLSQEFRDFDNMSQWIETEYKETINTIKQS